MVAVAIGSAVAGVVGGVSTIVSANKAASTASKNAAANNALARDTYDKNSAVLAPYVGAGIPATSAIQNFLGLDGQPAQTAAFDAYKGATGYQFRVDQGQRSLTSALGNKGLLNSGAATKAALSYGQGIASAESQNYLAALGGQQNVGLTAANGQAGVGTNYTNAVTANNNAASEVKQNAALATGSAISGIANSALGAFTMSQGMKSSYGSGGGSDVGLSGDGERAALMQQESGTKAPTEPLASGSVDLFGATDLVGARVIASMLGRHLAGELSVYLESDYSDIWQTMASLPDADLVRLGTAGGWNDLAKRVAALLGRTFPAAGLAVTVH